MTGHTIWVIQFVGWASLVKVVFTLILAESTPQMYACFDCSVISMYCSGGFGTGLVYWRWACHWYALLIEGSGIGILCSRFIMVLAYLARDSSWQDISVQFFENIRTFCSPYRYTFHNLSVLFLKYPYTLLDWFLGYSSMSRLTENMIRLRKFLSRFHIFLS